MSNPVASEARVGFAPLQQATSQDVYAVGFLAQASTDNVVENILWAGVGYAGLSAAVSGTSAVTVQPGYLLKEGPAYALRDAFTLDLSAAIALVPDSAKTLQVLILADGQESPTTETRTFLDPSKKPANPADPWPTTTSPANTRIVRTAVLSQVRGTADVQPQAPAYNAALCLIATVVVSNTGIVSVTQNKDLQITRLDQLAPVVSGLSVTVSTLQGLMQGLLSSVAANALGLSNLTSYVNAAIADLAKRINALELRATSAATATFRAADYFQDLSQSNPAAPGYNAVVQSGLRFATAVHNDNDFGPSLASNPGLQSGAGNYLVPSFYEAPTIRSSGGQYYGNPFYISGLPAFTAQTLQRGFGRIRTRLGKALKVGSAAQVLVSGDPSQLFAIDPSTFPYDAANWGDWRTSTTAINHLDGYWQDVSSYGLWTPGTPGYLNGLRGFCQPFTPSSPVMITSLLLDTSGGFTLPATVRLLILDDNNGRPDFTRVRADVTAAPITDRYSQDPLNFRMPYPVYCNGNKKYHFLFVLLAGDLVFYPRQYTAANTSATVDPSLHNDYLTYQNGDWAPANAGVCASLTVNTAQFNSTTTRVPLKSLQLQGGMDLIDLLAVAQCPSGCSITYEAYVGASYVPLGPGNAAAILGLGPNNVPINVVFSGTRGLAPVIDATVGQSSMRAQRASGSLDHVSAVQLPGGTVTKIHKNVVVEQWNAAVQTLTAALRVGAGYATVVQPDGAPLDVAQADGTLLRSWTWTLGTPVNGFEMELTGTSTDTTQTFVGRQSQWDAAA